MSARSRAISFSWRLRSASRLACARACSSGT
jgi:hypothetical protein